MRIPAQTAKPDVFFHAYEHAIGTTDVEMKELQPKLLATEAELHESYDAMQAAKRLERRRFAARNKSLTQVIAAAVPFELDEKAFLAKGGAEGYEPIFSITAAAVANSNEADREESYRKIAARATDPKLPKSLHDSGKAFNAAHLEHRRHSTAYEAAAAQDAVAVKRWSLAKQNAIVGLTTFRNALEKEQLEKKKPTKWLESFFLATGEKTTREPTLEELETRIKELQTELDDAQKRVVEKKAAAEAAAAKVEGVAP